MVYFTQSIRKVQRYLYDEMVLTRETAIMIDQLLFTVLHRLVQSSLAIVNYANRKTLTNRVFSDSVSILFRPGIVTCVEKVIRHPTIGLVFFQHKSVRKMVREMMPADFIATKRYTQYMTLLLQYLCSEIIELTTIQTDKQDVSLSVPEHLVHAIHHDTDLYALYQTLQMIILPNHRRLCRTVTIDPVVPIRAGALDLVELYARNL